VPESSYYTDLDIQDSQSASPPVSQGFPFTKQVYGYGQDLEQIESGTTFGNTSLAPVIEFAPFPSQPQYHQAMHSNESPPNTGSYNNTAIESPDFDSPESSRLSSDSSNQALAYGFMGVETSTWDSNAPAMSDMPLFDNFTPINGNSRVFAYSGQTVYGSTPVVGSNDTTTASFAGQAYTTPYTRTESMPQHVPTTSSGYSEQSRVYYYDQ
jgi:flavodoxin